MDKSLELTDLIPCRVPINDRRIGVYFLFQDEQLVYVGQSVSIDARIDTHIQEGVKRFNFWTWTPCAIEDLDELEAFYIVKFAPYYNKGVHTLAGYFKPITLKKKLSVSGHAVRRIIKKYKPRTMNGRYAIDDVIAGLKTENLLEESFRYEKSNTLFNKAYNRLR